MSNILLLLVLDHHTTGISHLYGGSTTGKISFLKATIQKLPNG